MATARALGPVAAIAALLLAPSLAFAQALPPLAPPASSQAQQPPADASQGRQRRPDVITDMSRAPLQTLPRPGAAPQGYGAAPIDGSQAPNPLPPPRRSSVPLGEIQRAWDMAVAAPGQSTPGRLRVTYQPGVTAQVRTRQFMVTPIHLPVCETIEDVYVGDSGAFEISRPQGRGNVVLVAPNFVQVDTNLQVITNAGRVYSFYLRSEAVDAETVPDILVEVDVPNACRRGAADPREARASPPVRAASSPLGGGRRDYLKDEPFDPARLRFDGFGIFVGDAEHRDIAPDRAFTDGVWTYLDYGERAGTITWPVASLIVEGVDMPVNTRIVGSRDQILVVEAVGDIMLVSGRKVVCIRDRLHRAVRASTGAVVDANLGRGLSGR